MSADDVARVREVFRAVGAGDADAVIAAVDPDVDWRPSAFLTSKAAYRGHDGIREWFADLHELTAAGSEVLTFTGEYEDLGEGRVLVLGRGRLERAVGPIEQELGWVYELRDDKVVAMTNYLSHDAARKAAGVERA